MKNDNTKSRRLSRGLRTAFLLAVLPLAGGCASPYGQYADCIPYDHCPLPPLPYTTYDGCPTPIAQQYSQLYAPGEMDK